MIVNHIYTMLNQIPGLFALNEGRLRSVFSESGPSDLTFCAERFIGATYTFGDPVPAGSKLMEPVPGGQKTFCQRITDNGAVIVTDVHGPVPVNIKT